VYSAAAGTPYIHCGCQSLGINLTLSPNLLLVLFGKVEIGLEGELDFSLERNPLSPVVKFQEGLDQIRKAWRKGK